MRMFALLLFVLTLFGCEDKPVPLHPPFELTSARINIAPHPTDEGTTIVTVTPDRNDVRTIVVFHEEDSLEWLQPDHPLLAGDTWSVATRFMAIEIEKAVISIRYEQNETVRILSIRQSKLGSKILLLVEEETR